jgi:hypothetical protein
MNHQEFISSPKSLLVAPAGYGKTYSIAECLRHTPDDQKQLILTHTHAGIASIKEKVREMEVESSKYHIETITGFAQKYVLAFCDPDEIPSQEEAGYFDTIIQKAVGLFSLDSIKRVMKCSYDGLFVDEYQDCSINQHRLIILLAEVLPTRVLGDDMQGIFGFKDALVDFENDLEDFQHRKTLSTPWRWRKEGNNEVLGESLKEIRTILESDNKVVDLRAFRGITYHNISEGDIYQFKTEYSTRLAQLIRNTEGLPEHESLLIIVPDDYASSRLESRVPLKTRVDFTKQLVLLEAIDDKDYYDICRNIDNLTGIEGDEAHKIGVLRTSVLLNLFNTGEIDAWFNDDCLKVKREPNKQNYVRLKQYVDAFTLEPSLAKIYLIILFLKNGPRLKTTRWELLNGVLQAIKSAIEEQSTVYEAMVLQKNRVRRVGRKIYGKCLGTTLLTKGLEFDTVVVLNAHRFKSYKHFYVAITRACKKLVVFSEKPVLRF